MIRISRKKYNILKIEDILFAENYDYDSNAADIIVFLQCAQNKKASKLFHTLHIDLTKDCDSLLQELNKDNRYKINRAQNKDNLTVYFTPSPSLLEIEKYCKFYDVFASNKKVSPCNQKKLIALNECKSLALSQISNEEGDILCEHCYVVDNKRTRCLYSASHFRLSEDNSYKSLVGRANRYLHWTDICKFKEQGLAIYDFGGLSLIEDNETLKNIDRFKLSFGGKIVTEYNFYKPITLLGRIAAKYLDK